MTTPSQLTVKCLTFTLVIVSPMQYRLNINSLNEGNKHILEVKIETNDF